MNWLHRLSNRLLLSSRAKNRRASVAQRRSMMLEKLHSREVFSADPLPVLMVIANQDFYYREYAETRQAIEVQGVDVVVAATTLDTSYPHPGSGQQNGTGAVQPDLTLANVDPGEYSAIVFVGGWGASQYQYAFNDPNLDGTLDNYYSNPAYNGDDDLLDGLVAEQKIIVNNLINEFLASDKHVAAICHGVTVLAWARVDGASPIDGRQVVVPTTVSSPDQFYNGQWRNNGYMLGQYEQVIANGGIASSTSGSVGDPTTVADDVIVDGRIITAENYDSAYHFGLVIATEVIASLPGDSLPPVERVGDDLVIRGTEDEPNTIYVWSAGSNHVGVWLNGVEYQPIELGVGGHVKVFGGSSNDVIVATDLSLSARIYGGDGHDLLVGGSGNDIIHGDDGVDRVWGGPGDDLLRGGNGNDYLYGHKGNNILVGGEGNDLVEGSEGRDILIGGLGTDMARGQGGDDILIGGTTSYDDDDEALLAIHAIWNAPVKMPKRVAILTDTSMPYHLIAGTNGTVHDDQRSDVLLDSAGADWYFSARGDSMWPVVDEDLVS